MEQGVEQIPADSSRTMNAQANLVSKKQLKEAKMYKQQQKQPTKHTQCMAEI